MAGHCTAAGDYDVAAAACACDDGKAYGLAGDRAAIVDRHSAQARRIDAEGRGAYDIAGVGHCDQTAARIGRLNAGGASNIGGGHTDRACARCIVLLRVDPGLPGRAHIARCLHGHIAALR